MPAKPKPVNPGQKIAQTKGGKPAGKGRTRFTKKASPKPGRGGGRDDYGTGEDKYRPGVG